MNHCFYEKKRVPMVEISIAGMACKCKNSVKVAQGLFGILQCTVADTTYEDKHSEQQTSA
jgi:hypothetical protein